MKYLIQIYNDWKLKGERKHWAKVVSERAILNYDLTSTNYRSLFF